MDPQERIKELIAEGRRNFQTRTSGGGGDGPPNTNSRIEELMAEGRRNFQGRLGIQERPEDERPSLAELFRQREAQATVNAQELSKVQSAVAERSGLGRGLDTVRQQFDETFLTRDDGQPNFVGRAANYARGLAQENDGIPRQMVGGPEVTVEERAEAMKERPLNLIGRKAQADAERLEAKGVAPMRMGEVTGPGSAGRFVLENLAASAPDMLNYAVPGGLLANYQTYSGDMAQEIKERGGPVSDEMLVGVSMGGGALMTALDVVGLGSIVKGLTPKSIANKAMNGQLAKFLTSRGVPAAAARVMQAGVVEGATESLQEGVMMAGAALTGAEYSPEEIRRRMLEATVTGGAVGGSLRGGGEVVVGLSGGPQREQEQQLDAEEAALRGVDEAIEQRAVAEQAAVEDRRIREERDRHAPTFVPFEEFNKQRAKQRELDVMNPDTELGQGFREWRLQNDIYPTTDKERTKAAKDFLKTVVPQNDAEVARQEHLAALDEHANRMAALEDAVARDPRQLELDLEPQPKGLADSELPLGDTAAAPARPGPRQIMEEIARSRGVELTPEQLTQFEETVESVRNLEAEQRSAAVQDMVAKLTNAARNPAAETAKAAKEKAEEAKKTAKKREYTLDTPTRGRDDAKAKADALLPSGWLESTDSRFEKVQAAINASGFSKKKFDAGLKAAVAGVNETQDAKAAAKNVVATSKDQAGTEAAKGDAKPAPEIDTSTIPDKGVKSKRTTLRRSELKKRAENLFGKDALENDSEYRDIKTALDPKSKMKLADVNALIEAKDKSKTPEPAQELPEAPDPLTAAIEEIKEAQDAEKAEVASAALVDRLFSPEVESKAKLAPNERKVWNVLKDAFTGGTAEQVVDGNGKFINATIAKRAGITSEKVTKGLNTTVKRAVGKLAKAQGVTPGQLVGALSTLSTTRMARADAVAAPTEVDAAVDGNPDDDATTTADRFAEQAADDEANYDPTVDPADLAGEAATLSRVNSVAGTNVKDVSEVSNERHMEGVRQYVKHLRTGEPLPKVKAGEKKSKARPADSLTPTQKKELKQFVDAGMTDKQIESFYNTDTSSADTDVVAAKAAERAVAEGNQVDSVLDTPAGFAALEAKWNEFTTTDDPAFGDLSRADQREWALEVMDFLHSVEDGTRFSRIEEAAGRLAAETKVTEETNDGQTDASESDRGTGPEAEADVQAEGRAGDQEAARAGGQTTPGDGTDGQTADTGVVGEQKARPTVETKTKKKLLNRKATASKTKMGVVDDLDAQFSFSTTESIANVLEDLTGERTHERVHTFNTLGDAVRASEAGLIPKIDKAKVIRDQPYGWVTPDAQGRPHVTLIADKIPAGGELAAFMHEVGNHAGMEYFLSEGQLDTVFNKITSWLNAKDGSQEHQIAKRAYARWIEARAKNVYTDADKRSEVISYFLEEATLAGIEPSAQTAVGRLVRDLWAAFKRGLRKMNLMNADQLSAQDIVNVAWGAARLNLSTRKHATGAIFRRFNHDYMGSGEGNQVFGYGTYLAEDMGIVRYYLGMLRDRANSNSSAYTPLEQEKATLEKLKKATWVEADPGRVIPVDRVLGENPAWDHALLEISVQKGEVDVIFPDPDDAFEPPKVLKLSNFMTGETGGTALTVSERAAVYERLKGPGPSLLHVDTTVADSELLDWDADLTSESASNLFVTLENKMPEDVMDTLLDRIDGYVAHKNGLSADEFAAMPLAEQVKLRTSLKIGNLHHMLRQSEFANHLLDALSPEAANRLPNGFDARFTRNNAIVSAFLDENGIKGIKYLDAKSRDGKQDTRNRVIFNDENLIVVGRTPASEVGQNTDTVGETKFGVAGSQQNWADRTYGKQTSPFMQNLQTIVRKPLDSTKSMHNFVRDHAKEMPSLKVWYDRMLEAAETVRRYTLPVQNIVDRARELGMDRKALVNDYIGTSTFYQKWGYDPQWEGVKVKIDPTMKKKWGRLTAEEKQIVRDVFDHGRKMRQVMHNIAKEAGVSKFFRLDARLEGPYAPLKRFGNYVAELKSDELRTAQREGNTKEIERLKQDANHYVVSFFDTPGAAQKFVNENSKNYAVAEVSDKLESPDAYIPGAAKAYEKVLGAINANVSGLDPESQEAMRKMVRDMFYQQLDESSARLSGARRMNRAGYDKDMIRAFAAHGRAQANLISQMEHGAEIAGALAQAQKEARKNSPKLSPVYNIAAAKFRNMMTSRTGMLHGLESRLLKFNTVYMLTSSIGYAVQNFTQPIVSISNITGHFGFHKHPQVWAQAFKGWNVARKVINTSMLNQVVNVASLGQLGARSQVELDLSKAPEKYRSLLRTLQLRDLLDVGVEEDLGLDNQFETGYKLADIPSEWYVKTTHRLYQSARYVEANNRIAAAVAAYEMASRNPAMLKKMRMTREEYAISIVEDTQGNFSKLDAPALMDALPRVTTQFRKYQFMMAWNYANAVKQALNKEADPALRVAGARVAIMNASYAGLLAGLGGIPMSNVVMWFLPMALGLDGDEPEDLERIIRDNVDDEDLATALARGIPAMLGLDMSSKLTQGDIFMPYNARYSRADATGDGALTFAAEIFFGPSGTQARNVGNMLEFIGRGDYYRAAEYAMPRGLRSYMETARYNEGGYTRRDGTVVADPRNFDAWDLISNAIGLPSTDVNKIKWTVGQQYELEQWAGKESGRIRREYVKAYEAKDRTEMNKLTQEWKDLQDAKRRIKPFFNNSPHVLKYQSVMELIKEPSRKRKEQLRYSRQINLD